MSSSQINESSDNRNIPLFEEKKAIEQSEEEPYSNRILSSTVQKPITSIPEVSPTLE